MGHGSNNGDSILEVIGVSYGAESLGWSVMDGVVRIRKHLKVE